MAISKIGARPQRVTTSVLNSDLAGSLALARLACAALDAHKVPDALRFAAEAAAASPASASIQLVYGRALTAAGRPLEAIPALKRAQKHGDVDALFYMGQALLALGRYAGAAKCFRDAHHSDPSHQRASVNVLPALLGARKYQDAVSHAENLLARRPYHVPALAFKSVALVELGRRDEEKALADRKRLLKIDHLQLPPGYTTLGDFNQALAQAFMTGPEPIFEPAGRTTRSGYQVHRLNLSREPAIRALNEAILDVVRARHAEALALGSHVFNLAAPRSYRFESWAVLLDEKGYQNPHIHSQGWMSGVYYVDVPPQISLTDPEKNGWLFFGRSEDRWYREGTRTEDFGVCPEPGMLVTFPSYFWHSTKPLKSKRRRISYAFDIIPS